ncbi:MAG: 30S ribosomal protein S8 [Candidatus Taylorbacteria bacterium RIFCSPHIGHO2_01_FULL_51_15]|uniref:Small ribosomal subunit protein uS8 n=1 Tax=Candidatus Taylorbacteria bacterium RIFCSPHIGHO2_01_FULL_51_15 TaxID=1802304 RepID=A0A1G2MCS9_9BACT|nr:MAG: 30S ribosomal protein S8 [Candidatus Taylorbacteria bacterium RIFCSPHIGHO2_01_FULL_51_15]
MDPISDFLNTLKMASRQGLPTFTFPSSRLIVAIAQALEKKGYVESSKKAKKGYHLEITLPTEEMGRKVHAVKRISRLSKRIYKKAHEIYPVRNGSGTAVLSTPKGILIDSEARAAKLGGEVLFEIW